MRSLLARGVKRSIGWTEECVVVRSESVSASARCNAVQHRRTECKALQPEHSTTPRSADSSTDREFELDQLLSGTLNRLFKLDMEQHCKWIVVDGSDGLGGTGCTRMRPEVAPARSWARFPNIWFHDTLRNLEGCTVPHRSIRE